MISWLLALHASSQVPYELLALVLFSSAQGHIQGVAVLNPHPLLEYLVKCIKNNFFMSF